MKYILTMTALFAFGGLAQAQETCEKKSKAECAQSECSKSKCHSSAKTLKLKVTGLDDLDISDKAHAAIAKFDGAKVCGACSGSGSFAIKYNASKVKEAALLKAVTDSGLLITAQKVSFKVAGLTCGGCSTSLTQTLAKIEGVTKVEKVCHASGHAVVTIDPAKTNTAKIKTAINATKYKVAEAKPMAKVTPES